MDVLDLGLGELTLARKQLLTAAKDFVVLGRPVFASAIYLDLIDILNRSKRIPSWKEIINMASTALGLAGEASEECQRALRYIHVAAQARNREHLRCAYEDMRKKVT